MIYSSNRQRAWRTALLAGTAVALFVTPVTGISAASAAEESAKLEEVVVTGSRIRRTDYVANSPIATVSEETIQKAAVVTLDHYLNTLPQLVPAASSQSNNPGNQGRSSVDLRSLGANRNLVLVDGRRPMVSDSNATVDLNTIPSALIESIEVITGGAGAAYGADAIAGVVNMKLKNNFQGVDLRYNYSDATKTWDAKEYNYQGVIGGNFADGKGNAVLAFDRTKREGLIKAQRAFAKNATSTTTYLPEGVYIEGGNSPSQAAIDAVFARYGSRAGSVIRGGNLLGVNQDGTLFSRGVFNSPLDVQNYRYPQGDQINVTLFPDLYSYNFDAPNILTLPLARTSAWGKADYKIINNIKVFGQFGYTEYTSNTALAPSPFPTVSGTAPGLNSSIQYSSPLITPGRSIANNMVIPVTNPFIPADLRALLASRTGDAPALVGSGATEAFQWRSRSIWNGLRIEQYDNKVTQYLAGVNVPIVGTWEFEGSLFEGQTKIDRVQIGNLDTQRIQTLLEAPDGGNSICAGGLNVFGTQTPSAACRAYLTVAPTTLKYSMTQKVWQGFVRGDVVELPAGPLSAVVGAEYRTFKYDFIPGATAGPVSGFNALTPVGGENSFRDIFAEALIPIAKDAPWAQKLDLNIGFRNSQSKARDTLRNINADNQSSNAYSAALNWQPLSFARTRLSYQRSVRAPNFAELFQGGGSAPQIFDPCSFTSVARRGGAGAQMTALCAATGVAAPATFVQSPGAQASITTAGNIGLKPETGDTYTLGVTLDAPSENKWLERLRGSVDYYKIKLKDPILVPSPNTIIANCYNYFGNNPTYSATQRDCRAIVRGGADILGLSDPADPVNGFYRGVNGGSVDTSGIDFQVDWGFDLEWLGAPATWGSVNVNMLANRLLAFKQQDATSLPTIDYAGSVSFFGEGLAIGGGGSTMPLWKLNLTGTYNVGPVSVSGRARFIDSMDNRASKIFPGETQPTGVPSVWYFDFAATYNVTEYAQLRFGVNNAFNKQPPTYAPNIQSGTDPSTYDVIGRRIFGQIGLKF